MIRILFALFIGLSATTDAFVVHPKVRACPMTPTNVAVAVGGDPHSESHGISKSTATIALAGLIWVGIVSGIPDIQPSAAAEATDAQMELLADQMDGLANKMDGLVTMEDFYFAMTALVLSQWAAVLATSVLFNDFSDAKEIFYTDTIKDKLAASETRTELKILNYFSFVGTALLLIFFILHSDTASMAKP
jgi:hypothetical protein